MSNKNEITIDVNCKMNVDQDTAATCLKLVEIFMNNNAEYFIAEKQGDEDGTIKLVLQKR